MKVEIAKRFCAAYKRSMPLLKTDQIPLTIRARRNRRTAAIRSLVEETHLRAADFVAPFFVVAGEKRNEPIATLPGISKLSVDLVLGEAEKLHRAGIPAVALFPVTDSSIKDPYGSHALDENGVVPSAIKILKKEIPSLCVIADVALDPFTSHGHDGVVGENEEVLNDETVEILSKMALILAESGTDFVAPSDMMDGRVGVIRKMLDIHNFEGVGILSYTAKYASCLYAPFRSALGSTLKFGDKKGYQLNPANIREALRQAALDVEQGADILMIKPALLYLDVIAKMKESFRVPIAAFHVSGEYVRVMAAHEKGYLDAPKVFYEEFLSIKRSGADFIFTYAISQVLHFLSTLKVL